MPPKPWPDLPPDREHFERPPREYGILPFWFLNGELNPDEMRFQLRELRDKGMPGIILHGRFGLELPYLGPDYLDRIRLAVDEGERLGLTTWIYDEMNWPSGTADFQVLKERPDLAQRYIECLNFPIRGPWFACLTEGDSRYIDALDPESTAEFIRLGYEPYKRTVSDKMPQPMVGFYTDEPAMHYYTTGNENPIVPWTKNMFRRFHERNGYNLRTHLPDLFFDVSPDSARVRHDFYTTLTDFYANAFYRQIHEWCQANDVLFTGHLLYEEWLRQMIRVEGNP